jgi:chorismate mutase
MPNRKMPRTLCGLSQWLPPTALALVLVACAGTAHPDYRNEMVAYRQGQANALAQCRTDSQNPVFDPIRGKIQLTQSASESPGSEFLSNRSFPSENERPVIAMWAKARDQCAEHLIASFTPPPHSDFGLRGLIATQAGVIRDEGARIDSLITALYEQRMTYGEFAAQRYDTQSQAEHALREIMQAAAESDTTSAVSRAMAEQQKFANTFSAFSAYMDSVNARAPQTVVVPDSIQPTH